MLDLWFLDCIILWQHFHFSFAVFAVARTRHSPTNLYIHSFDAAIPGLFRWRGIKRENRTLPTSFE